MTTEGNIKQAIPLFMVTNIETSLQFYINGLGFKLINDWMPKGKIEWCMLQREGVLIMLQEIRAANQDLFLPKGLGISIWFQCADALTLYVEFESKGINLDEPFVGNNMWDVTLQDPDGYQLHFESPTNVKEGTRYSKWLSF